MKNLQIRIPYIDTHLLCDVVSIENIEGKYLTLTYKFDGMTLKTNGVTIDMLVSVSCITMFWLAGNSYFIITSNLNGMQPFRKISIFGTNYSAYDTADGLREIFNSLCNELGVVSLGYYHRRKLFNKSGERSWLKKYLGEGNYWHDADNVEYDPVLTVKTDVFGQVKDKLPNSYKDYEKLDYFSHTHENKSKFVMVCN